MSEEHLRVLLLDDEDSLRVPLKKYLEDKFGYQVDGAANGSEALALVEAAQGCYDVALIDDLLMPGSSGIEVMQEIKGRYPNIECIIFTGWGTEHRQGALEAGAFRYLAKPFDNDELAMLIRVAAQQVRLRAISRDILSERDQKQVLERVVQAACSLAPANEAAIVLLDKITERLQVDTKTYADKVQWQRHFKAQGLSREIIRTGQLVRVSDTTQDNRIDQGVIDSGVRSFLGLPITGEGGNLGVLYVYSRDPGRFDAWETVAALQALVSQAGLAIANAQAFQQIRTHAGHMEALVRAGQGLTYATKLKDQLNLAWDFAREQLKVSTFFVALVNSQTDTLHFSLYYDEGQRIEIPDRHLGEDQTKWGISGYVIKTGQELFWGTLEDEQRLCRPLDIEPILLGKPSQSCFFLPLKTGGEVIGIISIQSYARHAFTSVLLDTCRALATQLAVALENARLYDEAQQRTRRLDTLQKLALTLNLSLELDKTLEAACQSAVRFFEADHSGLMLFEQNLEWGTVKGEYPKQLGTLGERIPVQGVQAEEKLAHSKETIVLSDVEEAGPRLGPVLDILRRFDIRSIAIVPIIYQDRVLGSFSLDAVGHARQFTPEEVDLCRVFAAHVAVAVENARLFSQLSQANQWQEALVENAFDAVIAIDQDRKIAVFNRRAEEMLGWTTEEMIGQTTARLHVDIEKAQRICELVNHGESIIGWEVNLRHRDGTHIPVLLSATLIRDNQGHPIWQAGFMRDLRQVKLLEERQRALIQVSQAITSTLELDEVMKRVMNLAITAFPMAQRGTLHLYDEQADILRLRANTHGYNLEVVEALRLRPGEGIAGWVFQQRQPVVVDDARQDPRYKRVDHPEVRVHKSMICVPLEVRRQVIGVLSLDNLDLSSVFQADDLKLLSTFADQVAIAIDNARLYQESIHHRQLLTALDEASRHIRAEKETPKLLQEIVRLAAELVSCPIGSFFVNRRHLEELELTACYGLPTTLVGSRVSHSEGLVGLVARTGESQIIREYSDWPDREAIFEPYGSKTAFAVPLKQAGQVEAVLLVADGTGQRQLTEADLEILGRFAEQASLALPASRLVSREQRMFRQLAILHQIGDYIRVAGDLDKILHAVLTGVTAGYGLGFNRAVLFLLDEMRENLVGRIGIGFLDETKARRDWLRHHEQRLEDFERYRERLERGGLPLTPVGEKIRELQLPVRATNPDIFSEIVLRRRRAFVVRQDELDQLPSGFVKVFESTTPLAVVPLMVRDQVIGLLVADNKFTQSPITAEDVEALLTFANTTAVAIDNVQLFEEAQEGLARLRSVYEASSQIVSTLDPDQALRSIVDKVYQTMEAWRASVILVDEAGHPQRLESVGFEKDLKADTSIRSQGISRAVMRAGEPHFIEDTFLAADRVHPQMIADGVRAAACLPLTLKASPLGVMWVHYREPRRFSKAEKETLRLYANQAAIAYDNARRVRELEHMRRAAEALAGALAPAQVLRKIVESATEVLQADSSAIWSYDNVRNQFIPEELAAHGIPKDELERFQKTEPKKGGTADTVMDQGWVRVMDTTDPQYEFLGSSTLELLSSIGAKSFQGVALKVGDEKLGVLYVNYNRLHSFTGEDRRTSETFAYHAALALKKARLLEQVGKARDAAKVVAEVTVLEDLKGTLDSIVRGTQDALGSDAVTLYTYDQTKGKLGYPPTLTGVYYPERVTLLSEVPRNSIIFTMLQRDNPYIANEAMTDPLFKNRRFTVDEEVKSCAAIPLGVGDHKVGVMFVNYRLHHRFTADELTNIDLFANQAAVAIRNAQLYTETHERAATLQTLYEAGKVVTSSLTLDDILYHIAKQALNLAMPRSQQTHFSHLALVEGQRMRFVAASPPEILTELQGKVSEIDLEHSPCIGITGRVAKKGKSENIGNVAQDLDYITLKASTCSQLAVPIKISDQVIGVINVEHSEHNAFDREDQQALEHLAAQAAIAIQNARQYEELKRTKGLVGARTAVAWMGMASSAWRHTIEKHALTIQGQVKLLRLDLKRVLSSSLKAKTNDRIAIIERLAKQILDKPITPPLSTEDGVEPVSLSALVGERAEQLWQNDPYKRAELKLDLQLSDSVTARVSPEWLRRAFDVLVENAVNVVADRPVQVITIGTRVARGGNEIFVSDTGPGIPERIQLKIGLEYIEKPQDAEGLGMGLLMAQIIVQTYGGEIRLGPTGPDGTTMIIWLPVKE